MKNFNIKKIIIMAIIFIIIVTILIILALINQGNQGNKDTKRNEETDISEIQDLKKVYGIQKVINNTFQMIYDVQAEIGGREALDILKTYENFLNKLDANNSGKTFYIKNAYSVEVNSKFTVYFAEGNLENNNISSQRDTNAEKNDVKFMLISDNSKKVCKVELYGENYKDIFKYNDNIMQTKIISRNIKDFNEMEDILISNLPINSNISDRDIAKFLYDDIKLKMLYYPDEAYELLDENYKKDQFNNSKEKFIEYVWNNFDKIKGANFLQYSVYFENNGKLYKITDDNNVFSINIQNSFSDYRFKAESK